jgi:hypothetical protein
MNMILLMNSSTRQPNKRPMRTPTHLQSHCRSPPKPPLSVWISAPPSRPHAVDVVPCIMHHAERGRKRGTTVALVEEVRYVLTRYITLDTTRDVTDFSELQVMTLISQSGDGLLIAFWRIGHGAFVFWKSSTKLLSHINDDRL